MESIEKDMLMLRNVRAKAVSYCTVLDWTGQYACSASNATRFTEMDSRSEHVLCVNNVKVRVYRCYDGITRHVTTRHFTVGLHL